MFFELKRYNKTEDRLCDAINQLKTFQKMIQKDLLCDGQTSCIVCYLGLILPKTTWGGKGVFHVHTHTPHH